MLDYFLVYLLFSGKDVSDNITGTSNKGCDYTISTRKQHQRNQKSLAPTLTKHTWTS